MLHVKNFYMKTSTMVLTHLSCFQHCPLPPHPLFFILLPLLSETKPKTSRLEAITVWWYSTSHYSDTQRTCSEIHAGSSKNLVHSVVGTIWCKSTNLWSELLNISGQYYSDLLSARSKIIWPVFIGGNFSNVFRILPSLWYMVISITKQVTSHKKIT